MFPLCSTCTSCSQAPLCAYTLRLIPNQPEGTIERLRYSLGGTAPVKLPTRRCPWNGLHPRLEPQPLQRGIPRTAPRNLAATHQSLPRILYRSNQDPTSSYSKAPRGLSVLLRVLCIFTEFAISPRSLLRQCPTRYAIRAGRNLPDKEFRYLRTVIVTAAVYWRFDSNLRIAPELSS